MSLALIPQLFTYQTRIGPDDALDACAELYGRVEREVFADIQRGQESGSLKSTYLRQYAIPARLFNAARIAAGKEPCAPSRTFLIAAL